MSLKSENLYTTNKGQVCWTEIETEKTEEKALIVENCSFTLQISHL